MSTQGENRDRSTELPARRSGWSKVAFKSALLIGLLIGLLFLARRVPLSPLIAAIENFVRGLGLWGPVVFALVYVAAVVALVPASALTLAAGALFGLLVGTVTASLASTLGAALSFLIARYLARDVVARKLGSDPRFAALDRSISRSGWVIVALMRLSPASPVHAPELSLRSHGHLILDVRADELDCHAARNSDVRLPWPPWQVGSGRGRRSGPQHAARRVNGLS